MQIKLKCMFWVPIRDLILKTVVYGSVQILSMELWINWVGLYFCIQGMQMDEDYSLVDLVSYVLHYFTVRLWFVRELKTMDKNRDRIVICGLVQTWIAICWNRESRFGPWIPKKANQFYRINLSARFSPWEVIVVLRCSSTQTFSPI